MYRIVGNTILKRSMGFNMKHLLFFCIILTGCKGSLLPSEQASEVTPKDLFSSEWTSTPNDTLAWDMSQASFSADNTVTINVAPNFQCSCTMHITGTETSGAYNTYACTAVGVDPGCSDYNASGTYTKTAEVLTMCSSICLNQMLCCINYE